MIGYALLAVMLLYYIVWERIIRMYWIYFFYKRQGVPCVGFPLPVVGNLLTFMRALKSMDKYSKTPLEHYFSTVFPGKLPPVFLDMRDPRGLIVVTDPKYVDELYIAKNKFFDKADKERRVYFRWFGKSIFHAKSDKAWQEQRKHLAAAFYKDKMNMMIRIIIGIANTKVQEWKLNYQPSSGKVMSLAKEMSDLVADAELASVFGVKNVQRKLQYSHFGEKWEVTIGSMLKMLGGRFLSRVYHPIRHIFDAFDMIDLTSEERENTGNVERFKVLVREIVAERRAELALESEKTSYDFLT